MSDGPVGSGSQLVCEEEGGPRGAGWSHEGREAGFGSEAFLWGWARQEVQFTAPCGLQRGTGGHAGMGGAGAEPGGLLRNWGPDSRQGVAIVMPGREDGNVTHFLG